MSSMHLIGYMVDAAKGRLSIEAVGIVMFNRIPWFLEILLPVSTFIGFLLAMGRMYLDSEMIVLKSSAFGPKKIALYHIGIALPLVVLLSAVTMFFTPQGIFEVKKTLEEQKNRAELDALIPGKFQVQDGGKTVTFFESLNGSELENVFIASHDKNDNPYVLISDTARKTVNFETEYLLFESGYRYNATPGSAKIEELAFGQYASRVESVESIVQVSHIDAKPTLELIKDHSARDVSRLNWRLSLPFMIFVLALLAVPLSETSPRAGKFAKLVPALIGYHIYFALLTEIRNQVARGEWHWSSFWMLHIVVIAVAIALIKIKQTGIDFSLFNGFSQKILGRLSVWR